MILTTLTLTYSLSWHSQWLCVWQQ